MRSNIYSYTTRIILDFNRWDALLKIYGFRNLPELKESHVEGHIYIKCSIHECRVWVEGVESVVEEPTSGKTLSWIVLIVQTVLVEHVEWACCTSRRHGWTILGCWKPWERHGHGDVDEEENYFQHHACKTNVTW